MPYIKMEDRLRVDEGLQDGEFITTNGGELNYVMSLVISEHLADNGLSYAVISDILGAIEGAKFEFLRRIVGPYEDQKIAENGDLLTYSEISESFGDW